MLTVAYLYTTKLCKQEVPTCLSDSVLIDNLCILRLSAYHGVAVFTAYPEDFIDCMSM